MTNIKEAIALLSDDNLIWSEDFERVREPLLHLLKMDRQTDLDTYFAIRAVADALVEAEVTASDPLEQWVWDAARQLGIVNNLAERSSTMAAALKKLFTRL